MKNIIPALAVLAYALALGSLLWSLLEPVPFSPAGFSLKLEELILLGVATSLFSLALALYVLHHARESNRVHAATPAARKTRRR